jgi:hypothetical protein
VRCTGERSGCHRCKGSGLSCVYEESRVGKVPGVRARKNTARRNPDSNNDNTRSSKATGYSERTEPLSPVSQHEELGNRHDSITVGGDSAGGTLNSPPPNPSSPVNNDIPSNHTSLPMQVISDIFDGEFELGPPISSSTPSHQGAGADQLMQLTDSDFVDETFDFDFDSIDYSAITNSTAETTQITPPRSKPQHVESQPSQQASNHDMGLLESNLDSQSVLACCHIINNLEGYVEAKVRVLDLTLTVVKKAVEDLTRVSNMQQHWKSPRTHTMFATIMYQIVELLEYGCADFLAQAAPTGNMTGKFDSVGSALAGFGFGSIQIDPKEQRAWRAKVVIREIQHVNEIHQWMIRLARRGPLSQATRSWPPDADPLWHRNAEQRLAALCGELRKVENGWRERSYG